MANISISDTILDTNIKLHDQLEHGLNKSIYSGDLLIESTRCSRHYSIRNLI